VEDLGVNVLLADAARNELGVLGPEVEDGDPVVVFHSAPGLEKEYR